MGKKLLAAGFVLCAGAMVLVCAWVMALAVAKPPDQPSKAACVSSSSVVGVTNAKGGQTIPLTPERKHFIQRVIAIGKQLKLPPRAWQIAIQASSAESTLQNLTYGDRDSVGWFQMRPVAGWGNLKQLHDTDYQIRAFYGGPGGPRPPGLRDIQGWEQMQPGEAAQSVEQSGFPGRYDLFEGFASALVKKNGHVKAAANADPSGCSQTPNVPASKMAKTVIAAAKRWVGTPYAWGGGTLSGPSGGMPPDAGVKGFDCSSLVRYAYAKVGITLPRQSGQQYNAGKHVPFKDAKPGDLVFWADAAGNPQAIHHVAIYIGNNEVVQAPQSGEKIKVSKVWSSERVKDVTRPSAASATTKGGKGK